MNENTSIIKTIPHDLFVLTLDTTPQKNEYDIIIRDHRQNDQTIIPNDLELCILLYDQMYMNNKPEFDINECLTYHYNTSEDKTKFLNIVQEGLIMQHASFETNSYEEHRHKKVTAWFEMMAKGPLYTFNNLPEKISHKILLLQELGIIEHLQSKYFNAFQNIRNNTDLAKLIAIIISETSNTETVRKAILGIDTGNASDPATVPATKKVKAILDEFSIEIKRPKTN